MVFGKKKLKPSHLAPPPPPKERAKAGDKPAEDTAAPPPRTVEKKRQAQPLPPQKPRGLIEPLEGREHI